MTDAQPENTDSVVTALPTVANGKIFNYTIAWHHHVTAAFFPNVVTRVRTVVQYTNTAKLFYMTRILRTHLSICSLNTDFTDFPVMALGLMLCSLLYQ